MVEFLASYPYLTVAANLSGLIGLALAFFFYYRGKERFALTYRVAERLLIQSSSTLPFDMDVPLSRKGVEVSRLTRSFILVRNTGNKLIEWSDLVKTPLIKVGDPSSILDYELILADDPGTAVLLGPPEGSSRTLVFAFLRPGDGFILKIDHTGGINELYMDCRTKAGGPIKKVNEKAKGFLWAIAIVVALAVVGNLVWRNMVFPAVLEALNYEGHANGIFNAINSFLVGGLIAIVVALAALAIELIVMKLLGRSGAVKPKRAKDLFFWINANHKDGVVRLS